MFIGIDLGGTNIAAGVVDLNGNILHKKSVPTLASRLADEIIADMASLVDDIVAAGGQSITAIGIGSPGSVDANAGIIAYAGNLPFNNVDICKMLETSAGIPCVLENDANLAAYGEHVCGAASGSDVSVTITLGTGVGGGVVIDGNVYNGAVFGGVEIGHHIIAVGGEACSCGSYGCFEAYASATALIRQTKAAASLNSCSLMHNISNITAKTPFDFAKQGDLCARQVVSQYIKYVAVRIANVINIFRPNVVVVGGGVCAQGDYLLNPLREATEKFVFDKMHTNIVVANLGNDAGIVGAALYAAKMIREL